LRADALQILRAGIAAADPAAAVRHSLQLDDAGVRVGGETVSLAAQGRLILLGAGKAAAEMTTAALQLLGDRVSAGSIIVPRGAGGVAAKLPPSISVWEGDHPLPGVGGMAGAAEALALARAAGPDDVVLYLLSGGASSLSAAPAPGLTLDDLRGATAALLRSGAPIGAVNAVRKHLSTVAGGQLALAAAPARVLALAVRDVVAVGHDAIGSGPTLPDPTTFGDALDVVRQFDVDLPERVIEHLRAGVQGLVAETPKPGELSNEAGFHVILSVEHALAGAGKEARRLGYEVITGPADVQGEAREVAARLVSEAVTLQARTTQPAALLWGGETTVTVTGGGRGGRNQELALAAALALEDRPGIVIASLGTDGRDGPTDAAGGMADEGTIARGRAKGLDAASFLAENDSYPYLKATGDLIVTGQSGTNVNDLMIALVSPGSGGGSA